MYIYNHRHFHQNFGLSWYARGSSWHTRCTFRCTAQPSAAAIAGDRHWNSDPGNARPKNTLLSLCMCIKSNAWRCHYHLFDQNVVFLLCAGPKTHVEEKRRKKKRQPQPATTRWRNAPGQVQFRMRPTRRGLIHSPRHLAWPLALQHHSTTHSHTIRASTRHIHRMHMHVARTYMYSAWYYYYMMKITLARLPSAPKIIFQLVGTRLRFTFPRFLSNLISVSVYNIFFLLFLFGCCYLFNIQFHAYARFVHVCI